MWPFTRSAHRYARISTSPISKIRLRASPTLQLFLGFVAVYTIAAFYTWHRSWRDPTSLFFDAHRAYEPRYSLVRRRQADLFIGAVEARPAELFVKNDPRKRSRSLCVGIPTVARHGARYFRGAVGSLLEGLSAAERERVFLVLFVAQTEPSLHPAFQEGWMGAIADRVLVYNVTEDRLAELKKWEQEGGLFRQKALFDYTYLMEACSESGTPYMALFEDDVIALDGWFHRTINAISAARKQTRLRFNAADCTIL